MIVLLVIAWVSVGSWSFVHWWTKDYDLTVRELPIVLLSGTIGPISYLLGWTMNGDGSRVLKRKRP